MKYWAVKTAKVKLKMVPGYSDKGFTLVEVLVSSVILAAGLVTLTGISTRCMSYVQLNRDYEMAWQLMDRQLTMIESMGIDNFIEQEQREGEFGGENEYDIKYSWQAKLASESEDALYRVDVDVFWQRRNRSHKITASTMLNGQGIILLDSDLTN